MIKLSEIKECPKCGVWYEKIPVWQANIIKWVPRVFKHDPPEHLELKCNMCGFERDALPADHKEENI